MARQDQLRPIHLPMAIFIGIFLISSVVARAFPPQQKRARAVQAPLPVIPSNSVPDDVQLVNAEVNPTIRIPVGHSSLNWTLLKPRIRSSYGWIEIDRSAIRYTMVRPSRTTKEPDQGFAFNRTELIDLKIEYTVAAFRAGGLRHWLGYLAPSHWDVADTADTSANSASKADNLYTPLILQSLQNFDSVVEEIKRKQQAPAPSPVVVQPAPPPAPKPVAPPTPPTLVIMAPTGASENQTIEVVESSLTIRGVAMDESGLPTITINGVPAALRPKGENVAEFWSDPITLKQGANPIEIVATSPAKGTSRFQFVAQFTPKAAPVDPRALGKDDIISLLQGSVAASHVAELVKERGIKFAPTPADLNDVRAAGGSDDLIQAIQQAASPAK